ncbi:MAG: glycosyltransferase family 4 protein [Deltaproteobacteria bacterium]|nr:glycosyltransferase family 4 protein [Deltaproteobacteria bacterium]
MRVLMFGWEFPPHVSGGLGTACFGLTRALTALGHEICFVLPRLKGEGLTSHVELIPASEIPVPAGSTESPLSGFPEAAADPDDPYKGLQLRLINSILRPYLTEHQYEALLYGQDPSLFDDEGAEHETKQGYRILDIPGDYGPNLIAEVLRYAVVAGVIAESQDFDVIHCHDWMTVFAGIHAKRISGRPLVLQIHATEYDRSGENINRNVYDIERYGMSSADRIIAVSHYTKRIVVERYGIAPERVSVVHNAVTRSEARQAMQIGKDHEKKIVLFLGRITFQKGPDYFVEAAAKVLDIVPGVTFIMAGAGDMTTRMIERVAELGIGRHFHFTGFLQGAEIERIFSMSDVYVMPSVSEPFGISPLEAMMYDVPVIISRQSGVSEILKHALKVDFWDIDEMVNKIVALLKFSALGDEMVERSREELRNIRWEQAAEKVVDLYNQLLP